MAFIYRDNVVDALNHFSMWIQEHKVLGPIVFSIACIIASIAFMPGSIICLSAGWAFYQAY